MNWSGHGRPKTHLTLDNEEKEKCRTIAWLFEVLSEKIKAQHNETILSLQYFKLTREQNQMVMNYKL